jgi:hypothetical protein
MESSQKTVSLGPVDDMDFVYNGNIKAQFEFPVEEKRINSDKMSLQKETKRKFRSYNRFAKLDTDDLIGNRRTEDIILQDTLMISVTMQDSKQQSPPLWPGKISTKRLQSNSDPNVENKVSNEMENDLLNVLNDNMPSLYGELGGLDITQETEALAQAPMPVVEDEPAIINDANTAFTSGEISPVTAAAKSNTDGPLTITKVPTISHHSPASIVKAISKGTGLTITKVPMKKVERTLASIVKANTKGEDAMVPKGVESPTQTGTNKSRKFTLAKVDSPVKVSKDTSSPVTPTNSKKRPSLTREISQKDEPLKNGKKYRVTENDPRMKNRPILPTKEVVTKITEYRHIIDENRTINDITKEPKLVNSKEGPCVAMGYVMYQRHGKTGIRIRCFMCGLTVPRQTELSGHLRMSHRMYGCRACNEVYQSPNELKTHEVGDHKLDHNQCLACKMRFPNSNILLSHHINVHEEQQRCKPCKMQIRGEQPWKAHQALFHTPG